MPCQNGIAFFVSFRTLSRHRIFVEKKEMRETTISFKAKPESVDAENRILRNVILAQVGEAKGHGVSVEQKFLNELSAQAQTDVLSNFGHNWNNMGFQLGRVKAVHVEGDKVLGDLHIYSNADNSPRFPQMGTWVMNQAQEDAESLMLSIRFQAAYFYQYDDKGTEIKLRRDYWGDLVSQFSEKPIYVALGKLLSVDVVDSGALTDKMFAQPSESDGFFKKLLQLFKSDKMKDKEFEMAAEPVAAPRPDEVIDNVPPVIAAAQITIGDKTFKAEDVTKLLTELSALKAKDADNQTFMSAFKAEIKLLKAENVELKALPAATPTAGAAGTPVIVAAKAVDAEMSAMAKSLRAKAGL
jgi:hypothetical protein